MSLQVDPVYDGRVDMTDAPCRENPAGWDGPAKHGGRAPYPRAELLRLFQARTGCAACPVLVACARWRDALAPADRDGVIAGQIWRDGRQMIRLEKLTCASP